MQYDISVREAPPQVVLIRHVLVDEVDLGNAIVSTFAEAYAYLGRAGIEPGGPPFLIYHHGPDGGRWEADICAPVIGTAPDPPLGYEFATIDGGLVATTMHRGPYETVSAAYGAVGDWAKDHGYAFAGAPREIYLSEPDVPPDEIETVLEWPVAPIRVPATARH
jgi:effector-binding domain-containing protein